MRHRLETGVASAANPVALVPAQVEHFDWLIRGEPARYADLALPPGGVDDPETLRLLQRMTAALLVSYGRGSWLVVAGGEVVGLCSYKGPPDPDGMVEIGYGIAASRRRRGFGAAAVRKLVEIADADPDIRCLRATTAVSNVGSQRILEAAGFLRTGGACYGEDGRVIAWRRASGRRSEPGLP